MLNRILLMREWLITLFCWSIILSRYKMIEALNLCNTDVEIA